MKVKKSKHVHHYRDGYTPVVRCHLSRRHKVADTDKDALYEYFETHDDICVREFARISNYAPAPRIPNSTTMWRMARWSACPASRGAFTLHRDTFAGGIVKYRFALFEA